MLTHPQPPKGTVKAWGQEKNELHEGQEMLGSRVKVPTHRIMLKMSHPIPGERPAGRGMKLCLQGSQEQSSQAQLYPTLEELPWGRRMEEEAGRHTSLDHCARLEPI